MGLTQIGFSMLLEMAFWHRTFSGLTLLGIGAAFWGVLAGSLALMVQHYRSRATR